VFVTVGWRSAFLGKLMKLSGIRKRQGPFRRPLPVRHLARLVAVFGTLWGAFLLAPPATAAVPADPQLTLTLALRWGPSSTQGAWTPYVATLKNSGGADFTGDVALVANDYRPDFRSTGSAGYPEYRTRVSVPRGSERSIVMYVIDPPNGYSAEAREASGKRVLARGQLSNPIRGGSAVGILSDLPQAEQKISAPLHAMSRLDSALARFPSAQSFPTNAVFLSGLNSIVLDQFDSAALSQAQIQALKDYVGLGGTLIEAGGPAWRRTLLPLPSELVPLRPEATATASLAALSQLGGRSDDSTAQVVTGQLRSGKVSLMAADGTPLMIESRYGAGSVIALAFDPFGEPFDSDVGLSGLVWTQSINRALSAVQSGLRSSSAGSLAGSGSSTSPGSPLAPPGAWSPGFGTGSDQLFQVLQDTPAAGNPPAGLLGGLLVAYVLLCGLLNYLFLKTVGRRGLMWLTTPLIALVFTGGAYLVGFGARGGDFYVTQVEVQRLGPEGAVQNYAFDGVFAPRRGDVLISVPANSLVSTAVSSAAFGDSNGESTVTMSGRSQVLFKGVAVWNMRSLQTLTVSHPYSSGNRAGMPLEAHLRLENGRVKGTIANHGPRPISSLRLSGPNNAQAALAPTLAPGASITVDIDLTQVRVPPTISQVSSDSGRIARGSEGGREAVLRLAATQALSGRQGELALVGLAGSAEPVLIDGGHSSQAATMAVVEPVALESADSVAGAAPRSRLVSSFLGDGVTQVDVYDFDLPSGIKSGAALGYTYLDPLQAKSSVRAVDVYDWATHTWRPLPMQPASGGRPSAQLGSGELATGTVRVRVSESEPGQASLVLNDR
jgi:hypothetical protein